ncbi:MAG: magnesium transporter [Holosporaceae bacterium]|jgi:magnesium transporter|nr:magnesium transporter [Holosporaceae bacterium]
MSKIRHISGKTLGKAFAALRKGDGDKLRKILKDRHPADIADFYEDLSPKYRMKALAIIPQAIDAEVLKYLENPYKSEVVEHLGAERFRDSIRRLQDEDVVKLVESLYPNEREQMMKIVDSTRGAAADILARYEEHSVGRGMSLDFVAIPHSWNVKNAIQYIKSQKKTLENCSEAFVVDDSFKPIGIISLATLISANLNALVADIADDVITVNANANQEEAYALFGKYRFAHMPATDDSGKMIGVLGAEDILKIAEEEISEDYLKLGGAFDEEDDGSFYKSCFARFKWLAISLANSIFSPIVISLFQKSIQKTIYLAALMPIVGSLGGNIGAQAASVMVRDFSSKRLRERHLYRKALREAAMGSANGIIFGAVLGAFSFLCYGDFRVSIVLATAMFFCASWAAFIGALLPIAFDKLGYDAALSSIPLVTTITDVSGYALFLGLAAIFV